MKSALRHPTAKRRFIRMPSELRSGKLFRKTKESLRCRHRNRDVHAKSCIALSLRLKFYSRNASSSTHSANAHQACGFPRNPRAFCSLARTQLSLLLFSAHGQFIPQQMLDDKLHGYNNILIGPKQKNRRT